MFWYLSSALTTEVFGHVVYGFNEMDPPFSVRL
jgi:hypothetical protein